MVLLSGSDSLKTGFARTATRALLKAAGYDDESIQRPWIEGLSTWCKTVIEFTLMCPTVCWNGRCRPRSCSAVQKTGKHLGRNAGKAFCPSMQEMRNPHTRAPTSRAREVLGHLSPDRRHWKRAPALKKIMDNADPTGHKETLLSADVNQSEWS